MQLPVIIHSCFQEALSPTISLNSSASASFPSVSFNIRFSGHSIARLRSRRNALILKQTYQNFYHTATWCEGSLFAWAGIIISCFSFTAINLKSFPAQAGRNANLKCLKSWKSFCLGIILDFGRATALHIQ
jgi:hypothetical protein